MTNVEVDTRSKNTTRSILFAVIIIALIATMGYVFFAEAPQLGEKTPATTVTNDKPLNVPKPTIKSVEETPTIEIQEGEAPDAEITGGIIDQD